VQLSGCVPSAHVTPLAIQWRSSPLLIGLIDGSSRGKFNFHSQ